MTSLIEFEIHGLAGRAGTLHRELDRYVNVFWGLNGTGKTSLLKILHGALENDASALKNVPFKEARVRFASHLYDATIERTLVRDAEGGDGERQDDDLHVEEIADVNWREVRARRTDIRPWRTEVLEGALPDRLVNAPFAHEYLPVSRVFASRYGVRSRRVDEGDDSSLDEAFADEVRRRWQQYRASTLGAIQEVQETGLASILSLLFTGAPAPSSSETQLPEVAAEDAYRLVTDFMRAQGLRLRLRDSEFTTQYEEDVRLRVVVAQIQEIISDAEQLLEPQRAFQEIIQSLFSGEKVLVLNGADDVGHRGVSPGYGVAPRRRIRAEQIGIKAAGEEIPIGSLSSGEKQMLRIMLDVLSAGENAVLIDEPELSMHVDWQLQLVAAMRKVNPDCQLLLATHSPDVMAHVEDDLIFQL